MTAGAQARSAFALRDFQQAACAAIVQAWQAGTNRVLLALPTGVGKTVIASHVIAQRPGRSLTLVHRDELVNQTLDKFHVVGGLDDFDVGVVKAERDDIGARHVVASIQTLAHPRRLERLGNDFATVWVDECFPAGTLIDGRPIETVQVGDIVRSVNHQSGQIELRPVTRVFRRLPSALVRVRLTGGAILVCTPEHPIYVRDIRTGATNYCAARALTQDHQAFYAPLQDMRCVRRSVSAVQLESDHGADLLAIVSSRAGRRPAHTYRDDLCGVLETSHRRGPITVSALSPYQARLLLRRMYPRASGAGVIGDDGQNQSPPRLGPDATQQSDAFNRLAEPHARDPQSNWPPSVDPWWQWSLYPPPAAPGIGSELEHGSFRRNWPAEEIGLPDGLQSRYRRHDSQSGRRSGWAQPCSNRSTGRGPQERRFVGIAGVDGVALYESGGPGRSAGLPGESEVFNLEVAGNHNYFANNLLVHNCHHAVAASYLQVLDYLGCFDPDGPLVLGTTATPDRFDGLGLEHVFETIAYQVGLLEMIRQGYLTDLRALRVTLDLDLDRVHRRGGDFVESELADALEGAGAPQHAAAAYAAHAGDRKGIVFTASVRLAHETAAALCALGIASEALDGNTPLEHRHAILSRLHTGQTRVVPNCQVLTEGFDEPSIDAIALARPTQSRALYQQMIGRGLRPYPDKADCLVIDLVGNSSRHELVSVASLLGLDPRQVAEHGVLEADEVERARHARREKALQDGRLVASAVDLLGRRELVWTSISGAHVLSLGDDGWIGIEPTPDGSWQVLRHPGRDFGVRLRLVHGGLDFGYAMGLAEDLARRSVPKILRARDTAWRSRPPTERRRAFFDRKRWSLPATDGEAADHQARYFARLAWQRAAR